VWALWIAISRVQTPYIHALQKYQGTGILDRVHYRLIYGDTGTKALAQVNPVFKGRSLAHAHEILASTSNDFAFELGMPDSPSGRLKPSLDVRLLILRQRNNDRAGRTRR